MYYQDLHPWPDDLSQARELQNNLQSRLVFSSLSHLPKCIAGVDLAYSPNDNLCFAVVVIFDSIKIEILEVKHGVDKVTFPYITGYLSFREVPALLKVFSQIENKPDLIFVDGHGVAHPRKFGIASHLGLWLDIPTIGIAKKKLVGNYEEPIGEQGNFTYLIKNNERIGAVLRSKFNTRPIFVSSGYNVDLGSAIQLTLKVCDGYRIPFPTRKADKLVGNYKKDYAINGKEV